ncbi:tetratricopeptide repeat protein [Desulfobacula sp.]|uniref:tetratricopeptide repeat protein n=1 Tax=Desulfobacula sp. TaxID=2593537 RepID=UPI002615BED1|nr:tetratricopeptide repeat protein [Desulfobacula sp.]
MKKKLAERKNSPELYYLAAKVAIQTGDRSRGESFLEKAVQLEHVPGFIYMALADIYKKNHNIKEAVETLEQCTLKIPYFPGAWLALANHYIDHQAFTTALAILQKGYKQFQDDPVFQSNLAWLLLENNQETSRALSLAQSAYEKGTDNLAFADTLGWAYYHKGVYSQAAWLLSAVEKKAPNNGFIQYHLGMTYYQQGEIGKAIEHLKIAQTSEMSKHFFHEIDAVFAEISKKKQVGPVTEIPVDQATLFSSPEIETTEDDMIVPQWKK